MDASSELIRDFVNTLHQDPHGDEEHLAAPADLAGWLAGRGLVPSDARAGSAELRAAARLREALRQLLLSHNEVEVDTAAAWLVLDETAERARVRLRFGPDGPELGPGAAGVAGALGRIVIAVHDAIAAGTWQHLKACRARDCEWAFLDTARNQSRAWCSMRSCGNRAKARSYRRRHPHAAETPAPPAA